MNIEAIKNADNGHLDITYSDGSHRIVSSDLVNIFPLTSIQEGDQPNLRVKVHTIKIVGITDGGNGNLRIETPTGNFITPSNSVSITPIPAEYDRPADLDIDLHEMPPIFGRHTASLENKPTS